MKKEIGKYETKDDWSDAIDKIADELMGHVDYMRRVSSEDMRGKQLMDQYNEVKLILKTITKIMKGDTL